MTLVRLSIVIVVVAIAGTHALLAAPAPVPATAPVTAPTILLKPAVEDAQRVIHALVTLDGKPLKDLKVRVQVKRTFGLLPLGEDTTDDEGIAAVKFPVDLPGNERGEFEAVATVVGTGPYAGTRAVQLIPGGAPTVSSTEPAFPRALWGTRAPVSLMLVIVSLIGAVWLTYARVAMLILAIRNGGRS